MDDIAIHDLKTFPSEDPQAAARRKKEIKQHDKEHRTPSAKEFANATKRTVKESAAAPPAMQEVAMLKRKILLYFDKLGDKISTKKPRKLSNDVRELRQLKDAIELELNSAGGIEQAKAAYMTGVATVERLHPLLPFDVRLYGLTKTIQQNQKVWNDMLVQFSIEHAEWFIMGKCDVVVVVVGKAPTS